jgi:hypothetical protein
VVANGSKEIFARGKGGGDNATSEKGVGKGVGTTDKIDSSSNGRRYTKTSQSSTLISIHTNNQTPTFQSPRLTESTTTSH